MDKRDIELMRLKTQMSEMYRQAQPPYLPSQQQAAKDVLSKLQENYKMLAGEYCEHFMIKEAKYTDELIVKLQKVIQGYSDKLTKQDIMSVIDELKKSFGG